MAVVLVFLMVDKQVVPKVDMKDESKVELWVALMEIDLVYHWVGWMVEMLVEQKVGLSAVLKGIGRVDQKAVTMG